MSVIVKSCPGDGVVVFDVLKCLFEKEIKMFTVMLPKIYDILGDTEATLTARCLYTSQNPHTILVLEDLTKLGFRMISRQNGIELDHCMMVIDKLARLHAASVVLHEKDPAIMTNYKEGSLADQPMFRGWIKTAFETLAKT